MKFQLSTAAVGLLLALVGVATHAEPASPAFPGNEAVRLVSGKTVVEAPPLTAASQRYVKGGAKLPPPSATGEVFMIESQQGLMECRGTYLSESGCVPSEPRNDETTAPLDREAWRCLAALRLSGDIAQV